MENFISYCYLALEHEAKFYVNKKVLQNTNHFILTNTLWVVGLYQQSLSPICSLSFILFGK